MLSASILSLQIFCPPITEPPCFGFLLMCISRIIARSSFSSISNSSSEESYDELIYNVEFKLVYKNYKQHAPNSCKKCEVEAIHTLQAFCRTLIRLQRIYNFLLF